MASFDKFLTKFVERKSMKEKIRKIIFGVIVIVILGGFFYWFGWRPTQIRKECYGSVITNPFQSKPEIRSDFDFQYKDCLRKHGPE